MAKERNRTLDVLKGILILFVLITHYDWTEPQRLKYLLHFTVGIAVPLFLVITAYLYALSFEKRQITTFCAAYAPRDTLKKWVRYTLPFVAAFAVFAVGTFIKTGWGAQSLQECMYFLFGRVHYGAYYYQILWQLILFFPVIYFIIKKWDVKGLYLCFAINLVYEFLKSAYAMSEDCYILLIFRYTFVLALGVYVAIGKQKIPVALQAAAGIAGIMFIVLYKYTDIKPWLITAWKGTSAPACLMLVPLVKPLLNLRIKFAPLELLGKASYNIFLCQIVYYNLAASVVYHLVPNKFLQLLINIAVNVAVGLVFYFIETPITKRIMRIGK